MNNTITTLAANIKKPNKAATFNVINDLIDSREPPTDRQLAMLRAYFMPATPAKPKTAFDWAAKAIAVKDIRHYLNHLNATGEQIRGTDGHRLHIAPSTLPAGYYDKSGAAIDESSRYPDIDRVIPTDPNYKSIDLSDLSVFEVGQSGKVEYIQLSADPSYCVSRKYLLDALSNPSPVINAAYLEGCPLRINYDDGSMAVIMPMRI